MWCVSSFRGGSILAFFSVALVVAGLQHADAGGLLWVGAHPDDETYAAPVLADVCLHQGKPCYLLVMTDGGKGHCEITGGCVPDVPTVRRYEMEASASYFRATLTMVNLEDSPAGSVTGVIGAWNDRVGGGNNLVSFVSDYIRLIQPDVIVTFDPRHGSSCHLDHSAAALVALQAAEQIAFPASSIYLLQTTWVAGPSSASPPWLGFGQAVSSDNAVMSYDATLQWQSVPDALALHKSQFKSEIVDAFRAAPAYARIVPLLKASDTTWADQRYQNLCPAEFKL